MTRGAVLIAAAVLVAGARAEAACTIAATPLAFGTYDVFQASPSDSTATITYRCGPSDHHIRIAISAGSGGTFAPRTLRNGADALDYNLYFNAGFTQVWGDGTGGTTTYFIVNPPNNRDVVLTVYARVPAGQDARVGSYTDTVTVTLEY